MGRTKESQTTFLTRLEHAKEKYLFDKQNGEIATYFYQAYLRPFKLGIRPKDIYLKYFNGLVDLNQFLTILRNHTNKATFNKMETIKFPKCTPLEYYVIRIPKTDVQTKPIAQIVADMKQQLIKLI